MKLLIHSLLAAYAGILIVGSPLASAQVTTPPQFVEYSAKFLCGTATTAQVASGMIQPGDYSTSINIHNPHESFFWLQPAVTFLKKAVLSSQEGLPPVPPSAFVSDTVRNDFSEYVDCRIIRGLLGTAAPPAPTFIEGWVVLVVPPTSTTNILDVVGVYTDSKGALELKTASEHFFTPIVPPPSPIPNPQPVDPQGALQKQPGSLQSSSTQAGQ